MHVSRSTKPFANHSWQVWRSIYNNYIDFKISSTVIRVQGNKLRWQMHKAISIKVQGKTSFKTTTQQCQSNFWFSTFYVVFGFLTHKNEKINQKQ